MTYIPAFLCHRAGQHHKALPRVIFASLTPQRMFPPPCSLPCHRTEGLPSRGSVASSLGLLRDGCNSGMPPGLPFAKPSDISEELRVVCDVRHLLREPGQLFSPLPSLGSSPLTRTAIPLRLLGVLVPDRPLSPTSAPAPSRDGEGPQPALGGCGSSWGVEDWLEGDTMSVQ